MPVPATRPAPSSPSRSLAVVAAAAWLAAGAPALARDDQPDRAFAKAVVFEVSVKSDGLLVAQSVQPGFLVGADGVGVTSYNALHGAVSATARFVDVPEAYTVELLTARPAMDLALVKLSSKTAPPLTQFISLAPGELHDHQAYWTLRACASTGDVDVPAGQADVVSQRARRADGDQGPFDAPGWILSVASQKRCVSGCPLVDDRRRLVGVSVWAWPSDAARPQALTGSAVDELLGIYKDDVARATQKGNPPPVVSISAARALFRTEKIVGSVFPQMLWQDKAGTMIKASQAAGRLSDLVACDTCRGTGQVTDSVPNGVRDVGPFKEVIRKNITLQCPKCNGRKLKAGAEIGDKSFLTAREITAAPPQNADFDKVLTKLEEQVMEIARRNRKAFVDAVNSRCRDRLNPKNLKRGEAVMFVGRLQREPKLTDWESDVERIDLPWDNNAGVLVIAPEASKVDHGTPALFVGIVCGLVTVKKNEHWVVLDHVSGVPFEGWTWP